MQVLKAGDTGYEVRALQRALNQRSRYRGLPEVEVDGVLGPITLLAVQRVGRRLGALESTLNIAAEKAIVPVGLQRIIRFPGSRTPDQEDRAAGRSSARARELGAPSRPERVLREARRYIGKTEQPASSNRAPWGLSEWIEDRLGLSYGVPWCGIFVGRCLEVAGVEGLTTRVAAVRFIYEDARAGRNGFEKLVPNTEGKPGDAVGLFGLGTHVGLIEKRLPNGYQTIEGNTSPGVTGSQSNGGGCYRRFRPFSAVVYVARPNYS